jgi:8-oxo-dGTP diphosphatase
MSSTPLRVVCGLIYANGRILATRREPGRSFPLMWEFPGGKLEDGELPEAALHRELEEELKLKVEVLNPVEPVHYQANGHHIELIPFVCVPEQWQAPVPVDHAEIRWIQPNETDHLTWAPADIPLLEQLESLQPSR